MRCTWFGIRQYAQTSTFHLEHHSAIRCRYASLSSPQLYARQNFGYYDRVLLLDTGLVPIDEEKILEFYDYTQVPIEIMPVDLNNLRALLEQVLEQSPDR
jgi:hypothetical protein